MSDFRTRHLPVFVAVTLALILVTGVGAALPAASALKVSAASPSSGAAGTTVSATISGSGFGPGAQVELRMTGRPTIYATGEVVSGTTRITCRLPIAASAAAGAWNVVVRSGGKTAVKNGAFTIRKAAIRFTSVPPRGSPTAYVTGKVSGVSPPLYRVTLYIKVRGAWWGPKPYWNSPYTTIAADGGFRTIYRTGGVDREATEFRAYLIPRSYDPPDLYGRSSLPSVLSRYPSARATR